MASYVLDKAYKVTEPGGVAASRVVIYGEKDGCVEYPTNLPGTRIAGVTVHAAEQGKSVAVRKLGIASVLIAGSVKFGEMMYAVDTLGRVSTLSHPNEDDLKLGIAEESADALVDIWGDIVDVFLTL